MNNIRQIAFKIDFFAIICMMLVFLFFPVVFNTLNLSSILILICLFLSCYLIGNVFCKAFDLFNYLSSLTIVGISVCFGLIYLFTFIALLKTPLLLWLLVIILVLLILYTQSKSISISFSFNYGSLLVIGLLLLYSLMSGNFYEYASAIPVEKPYLFKDNFFFTSITASLRDGNIDTLYEVGTGIYYHILGMLPAAVIANLANIPSHVALWGIGVPFMNSVAFLVVADLIAYMVTGIKKFGYWQLLIVFLFVALGPINPKYLIKFDISNILWIGTGYNMPNLPAWNASIAFGSLALLSVLSGEYKKNYKNAGLLIILLLLTLFSKTTMAAIVMTFAGGYGLIELFRKKEFKLLFVLMVALIPMGVAYVLFFSNASARFVPGLWVLPKEYLSYSGTTFNGSFGHILKGYLVFSIALFFWLSLRLVGIGYFAIGKKNEQHVNWGIITGLVTSFILAILVYSLLNIKTYDMKGMVIRDSSYDVLQFLRSWFSLVSIFGVAGILSWWLRNGKLNLFNRSLSICVLVWCLLCFVSLGFSNSRKYRLKVDSVWANEVQAELKDISFNLLAMKPDSAISCQMLTSRDIGPWYAGVKDEYGGFTYNSIHLYRHDQVDTILTGRNLDRRQILLEEFQKKGVDLWVASPSTDSLFKEAEKIHLMIRVPSKKWLYRQFNN